MIFPRIRYYTIMQLRNVDDTIAHVADQVLAWMVLVKESCYVFDVVAVHFLECGGGREGHRYYSICYIG